MERQISDQFEEYWESTGVTILNDLWLEKWGEYIAVGGDKQDTAQPVVLTKTQKMLHKNLNYLVGVFKAAINMQK